MLCTRLNPGPPSFVHLDEDIRLLLSLPYRAFSSRGLYSNASPSFNDMNKESVEFKGNNSNCTCLLPILPTVIRDARYQGDAR